MLWGNGHSAQWVMFTSSNLVPRHKIIRGIRISGQIWSYSSPLWCSRGLKKRNWFLVISMNARELTGIQNACWRGGRCLYRNSSLQGCAVPAVPVSLSYFWANLCISGDLFFDGCFNHNLCVYVDSSRVLRVKFHGRTEYFIFKLAARLKFHLWA